MKIKFILVSALLFTLSTTVNANTQVTTNSASNIANYTVKSIYKGPTAKLDMSDPNIRAFRTRYNESLKQPANFAGEYVITIWGCGTNCGIYSFISKRTGKVFDMPFGGEEMPERIIYNKVNSRLLTTEEEIRNDDYEIVEIKYRTYALEKQKLKLIHTFSKDLSY